jgi:hypothetical protein
VAKIGGKGVFQLSEFTVIQFDGPDSYWLYTKGGDMRESFKRVWSLRATQGTLNQAWQPTGAADKSCGHNVARWPPGC